MASKRELKNRWNTANIQYRINSFLRSLKPGHGRSSEEVFAMLEGLPFREEVPNGRDFRGADLIGVREMDFRDCDFSSAQLDFFYNCDVSGSCFDGAEGERVDIHKTANRASFRKVKIRHLCMDHVEARDCCFEGAKLPYASFEEADLRGSSFQNADCKRSTFFKTNLQGCDFRGAKLDEVGFYELQLDKSTDLRGASLVNVRDSDERDAAGILLWHGTDWRQATYDATTKYGQDPTMFPLEVLNTACAILTREDDPRAKKLFELFKQTKDRLRQQYWETWQEDILAQLSDEEKIFYEQIMDETYSSFK